MFKMLVMRYLKMICSSYSTLFGVITKLGMLRAKNQALLQMPEIPAAVSAIQFYENAQPNIKGTNGYVQFAPHQELTTGGSKSRTRMRAKPISLSHGSSNVGSHNTGYVEKLVTSQK